jgi:hypothetical protein
LARAVVIDAPIPVWKSPVRSTLLRIAADGSEVPLADSVSFPLGKQRVEARRETVGSGREVETPTLICVADAGLRTGVTQPQERSEIAGCARRLPADQ